MQSVWKFLVEGHHYDYASLTYRCDMDSNEKKKKTEFIFGIPLKHTRCCLQLNGIPPKTKKKDFQ